MVFLTFSRIGLILGVFTLSGCTTLKMAGSVVDETKEGNYGQAAVAATWGMVVAASLDVLTLGTAGLFMDEEANASPDDPEAADEKAANKQALMMGMQAIAQQAQSNNQHSQQPATPLAPPVMYSPAATGIAQPPQTVNAQAAEPHITVGGPQYASAGSNAQGNVGTCPSAANSSSSIRANISCRCSKIPGATLQSANNGYSCSKGGVFLFGCASTSSGLKCTQN